MSFFLITSFISLLFGFFVFVNKRSRSNLLWLFTSIFISIWSIGFFGVVFFKDYSLVWSAQYLLDIGGILVPVLFLNFVVELLGFSKRYKNISTISFIVGFLLIALNFTPLFKKGMTGYSGFDYWVNPGPLYFLFPVAFLFLSVYAFFILWDTYRKSKDKILSAQIKYIILAQVFGFGGGVTNFFPQLFRIYPFGNYLISLYVIFISYAILKHHLFNVRVLATELFTFAICIALIIRTLLSENLYDLMINGIIAVSVGLFGILLIRSVLKEVRQREQIEKMVGEMKKAYELEKKARKELERLDEAKTQFMMATQHHLRTPLTSIRGYLDLLLGGTFGELPSKIKEVINKIQISSNRLIRIVNEFLDVSQFQLGKEVVMLEQNVDLMPIIDEIVEELDFEAHAKGIYLKIEKPKTIPKIRADADKLKLALFNLFDNGIKYTTKGGVTVSLGVDDGKVIMLIKDTGVGIPKSAQKNLFNRVFERGQNAKKIHGTGRGIGLYIAGHIIDAHKGKVWVESNNGNGSIFHVELPISGKK
jgi:signal transduction histidine kinase